MLTTHFVRSLGPEHFFRPSEIAVANALQLERWRFWLGATVPESILAALGLASDFVANNARGKDWAERWNEYLAPAELAWKRIASTPGIRILGRATLKAVREAIAGGTKLMFIIAHHPAGTDEIEFEDAQVQWEQICGILGPVVSVLMVCSSGDWLHQLHQRRSLPAGGYFCEMPVREGMEYLSYLLGELVSGKSIEVSRHSATIRFHSRQSGATGI